MLLDRIKGVNDIKNIDASEYKELAQEIRDFLIEKISRTGGHLGSNLGAVELTMALHLFLNLPEDKLIWDVGHQSYTHKLLTGRRDGFESLRKFGGMSGFPKRKESDCDCFDTGHSSTSISAGLGLVKARDLQGGSQTIVSVIGDGSLTGGMAYEALNNAAKLETNFIIVLNDNNMSISENVGGVSKYLNNVRTANAYLDIKEGVYNTLKEIPKGNKVVESIRKAKSSFKHLVVPGMFFEDMGITYLGPVDGHDIPAMVRIFQEARRIRNAVIVHVITEKGKGFAPAERHPARFHGAEPFDVGTGLPANPRNTANYTDVFSTVMTKLGARDEKVVAITAAMPDGTGLKRFRNMYPERFFDVGIAEEHAVTFAAGLAVGGLKPVVAIYSSFLQRAYDQILHDVCIQNLPVVFAIDRAGLVGSDGETHQGIFDLSYLSSIPGMHIMAPKNKWELSDMVKFAVSLGKPAAIRYPRGEGSDPDWCNDMKEVLPGQGEQLREGSDVAILTVGTVARDVLQACELLSAEGISAAHYDMVFVKPLDGEILSSLGRSGTPVVTVEDGTVSGGFGSAVMEWFAANGFSNHVETIGIPDKFITQGTVSQLHALCGLDARSIADRVARVMTTSKLCMHQ